MNPNCDCFSRQSTCYTEGDREKEREYAANHILSSGLSLSLYSLYSIYLHIVSSFFSCSVILTLMISSTPLNHRFAALCSHTIV